MKTPFFTAILLAGGNGSRFGGETPKQFIPIGGKPLYEYTLDRFIQSNLFQEIIVVCHPDWIESISSDRHRVIAGGSTRQESVYRGLLACPPATDYVVIHDGVRPFVSKRILKENVEAVMRYQAVDTCIPSRDTLVRTLDGGKIDSIPPRKQLWRGQTPQSFSYDLILKAHQKTAQTDATDDCALVLEAGHDIFIIEGEEDNIKITTSFDLQMAKILLEQPASKNKDAIYSTCC